MLAFIRRGQAAGELSPTLPPAWISGVLGALIVSALQEIAAARLDPGQAPAIVTATVLHGRGGAGTPGSSPA